MGRGSKGLVAVLQRTDVRKSEESAITTTWHDPDHARAMRLKRMIAKFSVSRPIAWTITRLTRGIVRSRGLVIDTRSDEISNATRAALFWHPYESAELRMIATHWIDNTSLLVDLGARLGVVTSAAARSMTESAEVICVEPNPTILELARLNVLRNAPHVAVRP